MRAEANLILSEPAKEALIRDIDSSINNLVIDIQKPYHDLDFLRSASEDFIPLKIRPDDPALIIYTSGTTGKPKGAILTHKILIYDARNIIGMDVTPGLTGEILLKGPSISPGYWRKPDETAGAFENGIESFLSARL